MIIIEKIILFTVVVNKYVLENILQKATLNIV